MATLTEAQRKAITDAGLNPSAFEKIPQERVDKYFPPSGGVTPYSSQPAKAPVSPPAAAPAPAPSVAPTPAPEPARAPTPYTPLEREPTLLQQATAPKVKQNVFSFGSLKEEDIPPPPKPIDVKPIDVGPIDKNFSAVPLGSYAKDTGTPFYPYTKPASPALEGVPENFQVVYSPPQKGTPLAEPGIAPPIKPSGGSYPFSPPILPDVSRQVRTGQSMTELANQYVLSRSTTPQGSIDPELEKQARERAERILQTKFTPGGSKAPITAPFVSESADETSILEALKPQRILTPEEEIEAKNIEYDASLRAIDQLRQEYDRDIFNATGAELEELREKRRLLDENPLRNSDFILRRRQLINYKNKERQAFLEGKTIPPFQADYKDSSIFESVEEGATQVLGEVATKAFMSQEPGAGIVENPVAYVGRMLGAPVSGMIGAAKGIFGPDEVKPAIAKAIRGGEAMMTVGTDISDASIEAAGMDRDEPLARASRYLGGGAGLIIDFLLPVVPGYSTAKAGLKAGIRSTKIRGALPKSPPVKPPAIPPTIPPTKLQSTTDAAKRVLAEVAASTPYQVGGDVAKAMVKESGLADVYNAAVDFGKIDVPKGPAFSKRRAPVPFPMKRLAPEYGDDIYAATLARYANDPDNLETMDDILYLASRMPKDFSKLDAEAKLAALKKAWEEIAGRRYNESFEQFQARTSKIADILDPATYENLRKAQPDVLRRATLDDALSPEIKQKIAREAAVSSDELLKEVINFAVANELLAKDVFKKGASLNGLLDQLAIKKAGGFRDKLVREPGVAKHHLLNIGNRQLTQKLISTKAGATTLPDYARLTRTSFIPASSTPAVIKEFETKIGAIRDRAVQAISEGKDIFELEPGEVRGLVDILGPTSLRYLPAEVQARFETLVDGLNASLKGGGKITLSVKDYNSIAERVLDAIASTKPGYKSIFDITGDIAKASEEGAFNVERYYQKVLTPREVAGGTLESTIKTGTNKALDQASENTSSVISREFSDEIGQKWGSIPEDFKMTYRNNRALGLSAPEAWSKTIIDNYIREGSVVIKEYEDLKAVQTSPEDIVILDKMIDDIQTRNYNQMFDDYISMMYGGYENIIEAYNTTGRTQFIDKMLVPPFEMRKLAYVLSEHPFIKDQKTLFLNLVKQGRYGEALVKIRDAHAIIQGRGITAFIPDAATLKTFYDKAKASDTNNILGGIPYQTNGYRQGERGIFEIWNYGKETAPMFLVDDHLDLLSAQYLTRRQAGVVAEVYGDWSRTMPQLFPSSEGIESSAFRFSSLLQKYLDRPDNVLFRHVLDRAGDGGKLSDKFDNISVKSFVRGHIDDFENDILFPRIDILFDLENAKKVYVALIEDNLTRLSSSEAAANRYYQTMNKILADNNVATARDITNEIFDNVSLVGYSREDRILVEKYIQSILNDLHYGTGKLYLDSFSGSSDYISSIYPSLRQETTPLFFDTLKTAIRQAASSNLAVITKGPLEQVSTIPLTFGETARAKKALLQRGGVEAYTEAMDQLAVASTARKLEDPTLAEDINEAINKGLEATKELRAGAQKAKGYKGNRFISVVGEAVGSPSSLFSDGALARNAKGGVLGGNIFPNLRYLMTNYLTAPAIIYGSIGKVVTPLTILKPDVNSVTKALLGGGGEGYAVLGPVGGVADVRTPFAKPAKVEIVVQSPTGKVYTNYDIADMMGKNSIARSKASAELTQAVIDDIVSFSGVKAGEITGKAPNGLNTFGKNQMRTFLTENFGIGFRDRSMNIYQEIGNLTDTMFRSRVLMDALAAGRSEAEAIRLAREALFDYGNLSSVEKKTINKIFWFWTFRRNSYRQVIKSFLTNPARMKNAYLANGYFAEMDREYNINTKDYAETRPFIYLVNDKENKQRYAAYGPSIPQLDTTASLIDHLSLFLPLVNEGTAGQRLSNFAAGVVSQTGEMSNPMIQTGLGLYFGVDLRREGKELGYGIDPRLMAWLTLNEEVWATFQSLVNVEVVPPEEEIPGRGTYQGRQWRIRRGDTASVRNWFAMQQMLLGAGIQRNLRDYSNMLPAQEGEVIPIQGGGQEEEGRKLQNFFYMMGVITPIEQPPLQDQIEFNKRAMAEEFREGTYR